LKVLKRNFGKVVLSHFFDGEIKFGALFIEELDFLESLFHISLDVVESLLRLLEGRVEIHGLKE
jgi:hypothetical protein